MIQQERNQKNVISCYNTVKYIEVLGIHVKIHVKIA